MKKLLAISVALMSLNLYGADKLTFSPTGLEGWGKNGVRISVHPYSDIDKTFDAKAIKNQIELKLRLAGIKETTFATGGLQVNCLPTMIRNGKALVYHLIILPYRQMTFISLEGDGKKYVGSAVALAGSYDSLVEASDLRKRIEELMDQFLLAYLKANPKKKEKE